MKICYLGSGNCLPLLKIMNYFSKHGHEIFLVTLHPPKYRLKGINVITINPVTNTEIKYLFYTKKVKSIIENINPDLVHVYSADSYGFLSYLVSGYPKIISCVGTDILLEHRSDFFIKFILNLLIKKILKRADLLLPISEQIKHRLDDWNFKNNTCFFEGVEVEKIEKIAQKKTSRRFNIISVRRLEKFYLIETLLKAIKIINNMPAKYSAVIAGSGEHEKFYKKYANKLGLEKNIVFSGHLDQNKLFEYVANSDIFVSTSPSDGTPASLLEAMICKTSVIVTNTPANRVWVKHDYNGYLFEIGNHEQLAQYILKLLGNKENQRLFAERSYELAKDKVDFKKNIKKLEEIYSKMVSK